MSDVITKAVTALNEKDYSGFDGTAKFKIKGEGEIVIDSDGARASDEAAQVTLTADVDTFEAILDGDLDPASAFMSGKLGVSGDMGTAMKLGSELS